MDALQFHQLINHYPMIVTIIGMLLLILGYWRRNDKIKRKSLWIFFVIALVSVAVFGSGEAAGRDSGILVGSTGDLVRQHQEAARVTFLFIEGMGLTAVFGLIMLYRKSESARWFILLALVLSVAGSVVVTRTTLMGRHIKSGGSAVTNGNTSNSK
ncbi:MAG: hypothetical protein IPL32_17080 [Chloracidobacterium sp.]|nr:hypothetical protein [Chloracidobacterium sp.]